jgi:hypothetical protein
MLVIKTEIWPGGDVEGKFEIARIGIINRGGSGVLADYNVIGILGRDTKEVLMEGLVLAHLRPHGWMPLAARALSERGISAFHPEYTQAVADLLKRG